MNWFLNARRTEKMTSMWWNKRHKYKSAMSLRTCSTLAHKFQANGLSKDLLPCKSVHQKRWTATNWKETHTQALKRAQWIFDVNSIFCRNLSYQINPNGFSLNEFRFHHQHHTHFFLAWISNWERIKANRNEMNRQGMSAQLFNT